MITIIRKRLIQNKSYKIIVGAIVLVLAASIGVPGAMKSTTGGTWIAYVNGEEIGYNDYVRKVYEQEQQLQLLRKQYGQYADLFMQAMGLSLDPQTLAFEAVIREELLNQGARSIGIQIHDESMREKLSDASFLQYELSGLVPFHAVDQTYGINMRQLKQHLQRSQLTMADFEEKVQQALQRNLFKDLIIGGLYIPASEYNDQYIREYAAKKFSVLKIPVSDVVAQVKRDGISSEELEAFYNKENSQSQRYYIPEKRSGAVWKFDPQAYGIVISDEQIQAYFEAHKAEFIATPSKMGIRKILIKGAQKDAQLLARAQSLRNELVQNPSLFAQRAQEVSEDKATAAKGGLVAPFARGTYDKDFEKVVFLLAKDGDVSEVLSSEQGFEIIQRTHKVPAVSKLLSEVKKEIHDKLLLEVFQVRFVDDMNAMSNREDSDVAFKKMVEAKKAKATTYSAKSRESSKISNSFFSLSKEGDVAYYLEESEGAVLQLTEIQRSFLPTLAAIKTAVQQDYAEEKARKQLVSTLDKAKKDAGNLSFKEMAVKLGAKFEQTGMLSQETAAQMVKAKGLPERIFSLEKAGLVVTSLDDTYGYLIRLDEVASFEAKDVAAQRATLSQNLEREKGQMFMGGFVASLYRNAKIKQNQSLFNSQKEYSI